MTFSPDAKAKCSLKSRQSYFFDTLHWSHHYVSLMWFWDVLQLFLNILLCTAFNVLDHVQTLYWTLWMRTNFLTVTAALWKDISKAPFAPQNNALECLYYPFGSYADGRSAYPRVGISLFMLLLRWLSSWRLHAVCVNSTSHYFPRHLHTLVPSNWISSFERWVEQRL